MNLDQASTSCILNSDNSQARSSTARLPRPEPRREPSPDTQAMNRLPNIHAERGVALGKVLVSLVILACLGLEAAAIVNEVLPFQEHEFLWPFLAYSMFRVAHGQGELVNHYVLQGVRPDSSEVEIQPEDFGLNFVRFRRGPVAAMRKQDSAGLRFYLGSLREPTRSALAGLRLVNHRIAAGKDGPVAMPPIVVSAVRLDAPDLVWKAGS